MNADKGPYILMYVVIFGVVLIAMILHRVEKYIANRSNARILHQTDGYVPQYRDKYGIKWHHFISVRGKIEIFESDVKAHTFIETYFNLKRIKDKNPPLLKPTKYFRI